MRVEEGRLVEAVCPHCGNTERRAFGETESPRGELSSYALGWTSGHEELVGHMTVGLGVGNPGGGSFHIEARFVDDAVGFGFVDHPFEDVPEGGPDLTRDEALAHECADYVWYVVDEVWQQDKRALWMAHWLRGTVAQASPAVVDANAPVLSVAHVGEDEWQCFETPDPGEGTLHDVHLFHLLDHDPTLLDALAPLKPGRVAERKTPSHPWRKRRRRRWPL
jgi:hypothetical protein